MSCAECRHYRPNDMGDFWGLCLRFEETPDVCEDYSCRKFAPIGAIGLTPEANPEPARAAAAAV